MKNTNLVICASNWSSFVSSLRSNLKLGYGVCTKTSFSNGFFRGILVQGTDRAYVARLASVTGEEKESTLDLCDYLGSGTIKEIEPTPAPKEAVNTTIKRVRKPREKKQ